jgi:hypothetical protein
MEMSMTTTTMLAQQIASTRDLRRGPSSPVVVLRSVELLMDTDARN